METKFPKFNFNENGPRKRHMYFFAGEQRLSTYVLVRDAQRNDQNPQLLFRVEPHALYFALELFVKALATKSNPKFNSKTDKGAGGNIMGHSATSIINEYKNIVHSFYEIANNNKLMELIRIYEGTLDTRFWETAVQMDWVDTNLLYNTINKLREEIDKQIKNGE